MGLNQGSLPNVQHSCHFECARADRPCQTTRAAYHHADLDHPGAARHGHRARRCLLASRTLASTEKGIISLPRTDHLVALDRERDQVIAATTAFVLGKEGSAMASEIS